MLGRKAFRSSLFEEMHCVPEIMGPMHLMSRCVWDDADGVRFYAETFGWCDECSHPTSLECNTKNVAIVKKHRMEPTAYTCATCCKYPRCSGCRQKNHPTHSKYPRSIMPIWYCNARTCQEKKGGIAAERRPAYKTLHGMCRREKIKGSN